MKNIKKAAASFLGIVSVMAFAVASPLRAAEEKEAKAEAAVAADGTPSFKMEPMVVNIPDQNTIHYLKLQVEMACSSPEVVEEMKIKMSQLKDKMLFITSDMSLRQILASGGKTLLKDDLQGAFNKLLSKGSIKELYFTEFTVQ